MLREEGGRGAVKFLSPDLYTRELPTMKLWDSVITLKLMQYIGFYMAMAM